MLGHYRTRIDVALKQLADLRGRRLGLRHSDYFIEAFDVESNEVIANGTTPKSFYGHLYYLLFDESVEIVTIDEPENPLLAEFSEFDFNIDE